MHAGSQAQQKAIGAVLRFRFEKIVERISQHGERLEQQKAP
jgi:hypothetical protein